MQLDPSAIAAGVRVAVYETLPSTNAEALALARQGEMGPLWIVADRQTAGRGRRGNSWISPPGNLYATLLICNPAPSEIAPQLSFVAALAVHDAIVGCDAALAGKLSLKWPNDVVFDGAKLAGILIESDGAAANLAVAIGIGVNCSNHPSQTAYPATDLTAAGANISAHALFSALSAAMLRRLRHWRSGAGFSGTRADWVARARGLDGSMQVRLPDRTLWGRCEGLDAGGRLLLRLADGSLQTVTAGDVFPMTSGSASLPQQRRVR